LKLEALDHPKTMDLAARLNVELPTAIGYLELLWAFTGKKAPQGNIGKWPDGAIARACYWMGRPEVFTQALCDSGFAEHDEIHRITIHDWHEHAPRWVRSKLSTLNLVFVTGPTSPASPDIEADASGDTSPDTGGDSKGREGKPRQEPESERAGAAPDARPSRAKSATRIPEDFALNPERRGVAEAEKLPVERTFAAFRDYWTAASGAKARKHDWDATWRNWCRTQADMNAKGQRAVPGKPSNLDDQWPQLRARAEAINFRAPMAGESPGGYHTLLSRAEDDQRYSRVSSGPSRAVPPVVRQ
jgi:hypothetical protein